MTSFRKRLIYGTFQGTFLAEGVFTTIVMSSTSCVSDNLGHLTLHISPVVLEDAGLVSVGCFGTVYKIIYDGVLCAAQRQCFDEGRCKQQFQRECLLHSKLHHPNILRMLGVFYHNNIDQPIKVMELLASDLYAIVHSQRNSQCEVPMYVKLTLIQDISRGLDYLHTRNPPIVHACLSAYSVLLTANLVAKIGGFTFSFVLPEGKRLPKPRSHFIGSRIYENSTYCGCPFDIYSIGCIICEVIINQPFYVQTVDSTSRKKFTVHEVHFGKYEHYINLIKGQTLKKLVIDCMNGNPSLRPSALLISEIIANKIKGELDCICMIMKL